MMDIDNKVKTLTKALKRPQPQMRHTKMTYKQEASFYMSHQKKLSASMSKETIRKVGQSQPKMFYNWYNKTIQDLWR